MLKAVATLKRKFSNVIKKSGQTMIEYWVLIVLVDLAIFPLPPNIGRSNLQIFLNTSGGL